MSNILIKIRDLVGLVFRFFPVSWKGRVYIGRILNNTINTYCNVQKDVDFIRLIRMKDNTLFKLDLRDATTTEPFYTGRYEYCLLNFIKEKLETIETPLMLDVGAHIGFVSIPIAKLIASKRGIVHAFEPYETNYNFLENNRRLNNLDNLIIHRYALGNAEADVEIKKPKYSMTYNVALDVNQKKGDFKAKIKILDNLYKEENITKCDFIKLDVEGFETNVIKGGFNFIKEYKPIIFGEFNTYFMKKNETSIQDVYALLKPLGYKTYRITEDCKLIHFDYDTTDIGNVIFTQDDLN